MKNKDIIKNEIIVSKREVSGSSVVRRLRKEGILPGIIINSDEKKSQLIQMNFHDFTVMLKHHRSESLILDLKLNGGKAKKVLLKEVQHDPISDDVLHVDFIEVSMTQKMRVNVPVTLVGEPVGVSQEGGVLEQLQRELNVECLPGDLVETVEADVSSLAIGDTLMVKDLIVDSKLTVLTEDEMVVASVSAPSVEEEVVPEAAEEGEEGAEPAVISETEGEKKEESSDKAAAGQEEKKGESDKQKQSDK
ncbi:50S ribosomal protein L25 [Verrucomicrobiota bacterium]